MRNKRRREEESRQVKDELKTHEDEVEEKTGVEDGGVGGGGQGLACLPLCVTDDRMVRSVLTPMAMSSRWQAKKKLL